MSIDALLSSQSILQFCSFYIKDHFYGVNIHDVKEINNEVTYTEIPHSDDKIWGYVNIRGQIYLILDLRKMLGYSHKKADSEARLILFKEEVGQSFGVLVDTVGDVINVPISDFEKEEEKVPGQEASDDENAFVCGSCKLQSKLLTVLDARKILENI